MNLIIFAGGTGTRLWPLSRKRSPKQFEKLKDNQSTLQMAFDRIKGFGSDHIFVSTNDQYVSLVREQLPALPEHHIFAEPAKRDLAAAIGLTLLRLKQTNVHGTVAVLWSDHFMDHPDRFVDALHQAETLIDMDPNRFVFLGETPRFANHNLGWIHVGANIQEGLFSFVGWKYRPDIALCERLFASGEWLWNPGYFVFDIDFVLGLYQQFQPEMFASLSHMVDDEETIATEYPKLEALHFDTAILEKIDPSRAVVLRVDMGWSDPGTLYALKEALTRTIEDNHTMGNVVVQDTRDCLVHNEEPEKLVATVGLDGIVVVNTKDALLVCAKDAVPDVKRLLDTLDAQGLGEHL